MKNDVGPVHVRANTLSRRGFLNGPLKGSVAYMLLAGTGIGLTGCSRETFASDKNPYMVWQELQKALRTSPDHTVGAAERAVASGDLATIHRFVRDDIRLVSLQGAKFELGHKLRFGPRAALRAGAGTAREKAEILKDLTAKAGFKSEIVEISAPSRDQVAKLFFREHERPFAPAISEAQFENWQMRLGHAEGPSTANYAEIDTDAPAHSQTLQAIRSVIGEGAEGLGRSRYDNRPVGKLPVLRLTGPNDEALLLDPCHPSAEAMPWPEDLSFKLAPPVEIAMPVSIEITATRSLEPETSIPLLKGEWDASDLAGRQVKLGFKSSPDTITSLVTPIQDLRTFVPLLSLQALDGGEVAAEKTDMLGDAITLDGDHIAIDDAGNLRVNGQPIAPGQRSEKASAVASVDMAVNSTFFPDVRVTVTPRDSDGQIVDGLTSGDFAFTDQGEAVAHTVRTFSNAPNILFLADRSMSMPDAYRGERDGMKALVARVEKAAKAIHPEAVVELKGTSSRLWEEVTKAVKSTRANLIVYATDGHLNGARPDPKMLDILSSGPPVIVINVWATMDYTRGRYATNVFDEIATATGGIATDIGEDGQADPAAFIAAHIQQAERPAYEISYRARTDQPETRMSVAKIGRASGSSQYDIPKERGPADRLSSVSVTVTVGGKSITRVLAGSRTGAPATDEELDQIHGALLGTHLIAFEGAAPSFSTVMDDLLTARRGLEALDRASILDGVDEAPIIEALEKGIPYLPGRVATLLMRPSALSGSNFSCSELGMTVILHSCYVLPGTDKVFNKVDILPLLETHVIAEEKTTVVARNFDRTMQLARGEAAMFDTSTLSLLEGKSLAIIPRRPFRDSDLAPEEIERWRIHIEALRAVYPHPGAYFIGAADGSTRAMWIVDKKTGEILGVLPDLSGGGEAIKRIEDQLKALDTVITALNLAAGLAGVGSPALGIAASYGQRLARLYAAVSISIILMDTRGIAPAIRLAMIGMICEVAKNITLGAFSGAGKVINKAVNIWSTHEGVLGLLGTNETLAKNEDYKTWSGAISCPL